jgi:hypothetical protein
MYIKASIRPAAHHAVCIGIKMRQLPHHTSRYGAVVGVKGLTIDA